MARRHGARGRPGRVRYSWHGFFMNTPLAPSDILRDIFVLYDPLDADHQEEVVHERTIGTMWVRNPNTSVESVIGFGIYVVNADDTRTVLNAPDPLGISAFDIESNWTLYNHIVPMPIQPAADGGSIQYLRFDINVKARRKVQDPQMVVMVVRGSAVDRWRYQFQARTLVREGRF